MGSIQNNALLINDSAIGTDQTVRYVLVVGADNKVQYRPVKLGPIIDGLRVVTDGLKPGETNVVNGLQRVRPGSPVTPERVAMGERERGDKPQTLFARNSKLAWNMPPVSTTTATAADAVWLGGDARAHAGRTATAPIAATPATVTPTAAAPSAAALPDVPLGEGAGASTGNGAAIIGAAANEQTAHSAHVALNNPEVSRPDSDAAPSND